MKWLTAFTLILSSMALPACQQDESSSDLHIVGGRKVQSGSLAANSTVALTNGDQQTLCTGTLIAPNLVVSAAHCIDDKIPEEIQIFFGTNVRDRHPTIIPVSAMGMYKPSGAKHFPNFDIAWLKLAQDAPSSHTPIEILRDASRLSEASKILLAGYGKTATVCDDCVGQLLEVETKFSRIIDNHRFFNLVVFGPLFGKGACHGDSGGPAYALVDDRWYLIGATNGMSPVINQGIVTSRNRCEEGESIYTLVGDYFGWIEEESGISLQNDSSHNRVALPRRSLAPLDSQPNSWSEWVRFDNHWHPGWYTTDRLLERFVFQNNPDDRYAAYMNPELTQENVDRLTELRLDGTPFSFALLTYRNEQISNIEPLSILTELTELELENQQISDFSPLQSLKKLRRLKIKSNFDFLDERSPIDFDGSFLNGLDLEFLEIDTHGLGRPNLQQVVWSRLESLKELTLKGIGTDLGSLESLADLSQLKVLDLSKNDLSNIASLQGLDQIEVLNLSHNPRLQLESLPFHRLRQVKKLSIESANLVDIHTLAKLNNLEELYLNNNQIVDIDILSTLPNLKRLELNQNRINDIKVLASLTNLEYVSARDNPIEEGQTCPDHAICEYPVPSPNSLLEACELAFNLHAEGRTEYWLEYLLMVKLLDQVGHDPAISSAAVCPEAVTKMQGIKNLSLVGSNFGLEKFKIRNIALLSQLTSLEKLDLSYNLIEDFKSISKLPSLKELNLSANRLTALTGIEELPLLETLHIGSNPFLSLAGLESSSLRSLDLSLRPYTGQETEPMSLEGIGELPRLKSLKIDNRSIIALSPLSHLQSLERIELRYNKVEDLSSLWDLNSLHELRSFGNPLKEKACRLQRSDGFCWFDLQRVAAGDEIDNTGRVIAKPAVDVLPDLKLPEISRSNHYITGADKSVYEY
ncbi:MAG: leucine-rich repeat domain-containing protein [Oligoflexus sp.]